MRFRLALQSMTLDDLELLKVQFFSEFCVTSHFWVNRCLLELALNELFHFFEESPTTPKASVLLYTLLIGWLVGVQQVDIRAESVQFDID